MNRNLIILMRLFGGSSGYASAYPVGAKSDGQAGTVLTEYDFAVDAIGAEIAGQAGTVVVYDVDESFYSGDFVLFDATVSGSWEFGNSMVFSIGSGISTILYQPTTGTTEEYPSTPLMWHVNSNNVFPGGDGLAAVRMREKTAGTFSFEGATAGTWVRMNTPHTWSVGVGGSATGIFEMALWADTSTVLARATLTVENTA